MDVYAHEKEQIENIKAWWRENRWYIVGGLVIAAALVGGWRAWQEHRQQQSEAASQKYAAAVTQASTQDLDALRATVAELQADYSATPYASLATLKLAAALADAEDHASAAGALRWVMDNTGDDELALVARLRLGRVLLQQGQPADVHRVLDVANAGRFEPLFEELRGDAFLAAGDRDNARGAYEAALAAMDPATGVDNTRLVQMKLDNLAMPLDALFGEVPTPSSEQPTAAEPEGEGSGE